MRRWKRNQTDTPYFMYWNDIRKNLKSESWILNQFQFFELKKIARRKKLSRFIIPEFNLQVDQTVP